MNYYVYFATVLIAAAAVIAAPAHEGAAYTNEAIRQAQNSRLIPQGAEIQNVSCLVCVSVIFTRSFWKMYDKTESKTSIQF